MDPKKKATIIGGCIIIVKVIVLAILFGGGVWGAGRFVKNNSFDASKYNKYNYIFWLKVNFPIDICFIDPLFSNFAQLYKARTIIKWHTMHLNSL